MNGHKLVDNVNAGLNSMKKAYMEMADVMEKYVIDHSYTSGVVAGLDLAIQLLNSEYMAANKEVDAVETHKGGYTVVLENDMLNHSPRYEYAKEFLNKNTVYTDSVKCLKDKAIDDIRYRLEQIEAFSNGKYLHSFRNNKSLKSWMDINGYNITCNADAILKAILDEHPHL